MPAELSVCSCLLLQMHLQVEYSEEPGTMFYFRYPLAGGGPDDFLPVATTRPETILGEGRAMLPDNCSLLALPCLA